MKYDKPFLTYDEQINLKLIDEYGLVIKNPNFARNALISMSYYDLINGYQECLMQNGKFKEHISIEYLYEFHRFNVSLQNILFKYSIYVETKFKSALAYVISNRYGVHQDSYLNIENFNARADGLKKTLYKIKNVYSCDIKYMEHPTLHYKTTKNHIPPWILFKNITFNTATNLYTCLKSDAKIETCDILVPSEILSNEDRMELLKKALIITRKFRNKIAHSLKFVSYRTSEELPHYIHKLFYGTLTHKTDTAVGKNDVYSMILSLIILLNDPVLIKDMLLEIITILVSSNKNIYHDYKHITNLPVDLVDRLKLFIDNHINISNWTILDTHIVENRNIIKGSKSKIYHVPSGAYYNRVKCCKEFLSEQDAIDAGYVRAKA